LILKTVVAGTRGGCVGNVEGNVLQAQELKTSNQGEKGPVVAVQEEKEMEISSLEASERSGAVSIEGSVGESIKKYKKGKKR
jgi:hypothetical protein